MESLLQGLPGVIVYINDILIAGADGEASGATTKSIVSIIESWFMSSKRQIPFQEASVPFLGHRVDSDGLHSLPDKVEAVCLVVNVVHPSTSEHQGIEVIYLGLLSYYSKYQHNISSVLSTLYSLFLKKVAVDLIISPGTLQP